MGQQQDIETIRNQLHTRLPDLAARYPVRSLGVFGSYARGEQRPDSDLDLLVTFDRTPGLLRLIALEHELSDLLQVEVDLVPRSALRPTIGARILEEVLPV